MGAMSKDEKSIMRDRLMRFHINGFKQKCYSVYVNKTEIFNHAITLAFTLQRGGIEGRIVMVYCIKDKVCYSLTCFGTTSTIFYAADVAKTLKIDGIPFEEWVST